MSVPAVQRLGVLAREDKSLFSSIREKAFHEVHRRLSDPDLAAEIPDGQLLRFARDVYLVGLEEEKRAGADARPQTVNVFAFLEGAKGLPAERQQSLLVQAIRSLEAEGRDTAQLQAALAELAGEEQAKNLLAIEGSTA